METKEKINIHSGHRKRLRESILKSGIYNISDLHFLEQLLTFTIPRADTNPIAHALLKEFKTIKGIFDASYQSLIKVKGVGDKTARFLEYLPVCSYYYNKSKFTKITILDTPATIVNCIINILPPCKNEQFVIIALNKDNSIKTYKIFEGLNDSFVALDSFTLTEFLINNKVKYCIFAHTHPYSSCKPSLKDIESFDKLNSLTNSLDVKIMDNLIISSEDFYSTKHNTIFSLKDITLN